MSDWITNLKQAEDTNERAQRQREEWKLRCDRLIAAKAPALWQALIEQIKSDIGRLKEEFPDKDSKHLQFEEAGGGFTLVNAATRKNVVARWMPDARAVGLEFHHQAEFMSPVQTSHSEIRFQVTDKDDVLLSLSSPGEPSVIAEQLIKRLL